MITKQHSHYFKFLAQNNSMLCIGNKENKSVDKVLKLFKTNLRVNLNNEELDNLTYNLMSGNINLVLLDFTLDEDLAIKFYNNILKHNDRIVILGIVSSGISEKMSKIITSLDSILFEPFNIYELKDKLFGALSIAFTIEELGHATIDKQQISCAKKSEELNVFFDTYEGSALFVIDELFELNNCLRKGELSESILSNISKYILEVSDIFKENSCLDEIVPIFNNLSNYLKNNVDLEKIKPQSLVAFDYLTLVLEDINTNLMDLFVHRVFSDVGVFKNSLINNINFMESSFELKSSEEDHSEMEFLND